MEKILWIGSRSFSGSLKGCGWSQVSFHDLDKPEVFCWKDLLKLAGFKPDVLVVADRCLLPAVLGVEKFPCVTVFYAQDAKLRPWEMIYAQSFDACLVAMKDQLEGFAGSFLDRDRIWWMPPFAMDEEQPDERIEKSRDCVFVGSPGTDIPPGSLAFLDSLGALVPGLEVMRGDYREIYPQARVLVNHAVQGDFNSRVFEAMGCGGCLVTPRVGNGLAELFVDGEHLVGYTPDDAGDAAYRINFLLDHPDICDHIGKTARAEVDARHRARHRAESFTDHLCDIFLEDPLCVIANRQAVAEEIGKENLKLPFLQWSSEMENPGLKAAYAAASKGCFGLDGSTD